MFGFGKKRVLAKMDGLTKMSQMAIYMMLSERSNFDSAQSDEERNEIAQKGAVWSNYLLGKAPSKQHAHLDLETEHGAARNWLQENTLARELVVQSLRVANTVGYGINGTSPQIGIKLLEMFGSEFPNEPNPAAYEALVNEAISTLSLKNQQSLLAWANKSI
jgi:hypothetical protein